MDRWAYEKVLDLLLGLPLFDLRFAPWKDRYEKKAFPL